MLEILKDKLFVPKMRTIKKIHMVGIGGAGMCGIAEVLHNEGYTVQGSDLQTSKTTERLKNIGIKIYLGHNESNIDNIDVLVKSTAIEETNPEIIAARQKGIAIIPRAAMLAELMRFRYGIAIAGTHGKTTTTSLVSSILAEAGLDPSFVIGGKLNSCGTNAKLGHSMYFVAEADESDASFLFLKPMMAVITNIDADHMETYNNDFSKLQQTFLEFIHHLPFHGLAAICIDDPVVANLAKNIERPVATYGFADDAQYRAINWKHEGVMSKFTIKRPHHSNLEVTFPWPGRHNVQNCLAAVAIATSLEIADDYIIKALSKFQGVGRRFQILGERVFKNGKAIIVDDYGHHPREIKATLDAARMVWPNNNLIHIFQPHRFSRTKSLFADFVDVLKNADTVFLLDIYPAGEHPIENITSQSLANEINKNHSKVFVVNQQNLLEYLENSVTDNSIILMQGAGNITQIAQSLAKQCSL